MNICAGLLCKVRGRLDVPQAHAVNEAHNPLVRELEVDDLGVPLVVVCKGRKNNEGG